MSAKPRHDTQSLSEPPGDDADRLRSMVSAMLSGSYPEEVWLRDVSAQCRAKPEFGRSLLALIERYSRLGQMPAAQFNRVRQKIEQSMPAQVSARQRDDPRTTDSAGARKSARLPALPTEATVTAPLATESAQSRPAPPRARRPGPAGPSAPAVPMSRSSPASPVAASPAPVAAAPAAAERPVVTPPLAPRKPTGVAPPPPPQLRDLPAPKSPDTRRTDVALVVAPGTVLRERYELQSLLGCGGMAKVYKALDRYRASLGLPDCHVALKIVTPNSAKPADDALGREFHNGQQLSHPNIVNVFEIDHEAGAAFYTMELLEGEQLDELLGRLGGPLPIAQALAVVRDIGAAIEHAHSRGVLHADLKPQNVFVTFGGQVRVLDFGGLSMPLHAHWLNEPALSPAPEHYRTATPAYASCEQLEGQQVDPRDDIYALACIGYELLTGRHPFDGHTALQARAQHMHARRPRALTTRSWRALRRALSFRRAQRPCNIGLWLEQLGVAAAPVRLPPSFELRTPPPRSYWGRWVALAASLILCVGATVVLVRQNPGRPGWNALLASARSSLQEARETVQGRLAGSPGLTAHTDTAPGGVAPLAQRAVPEATHQHSNPPLLVASAAPPGSAAVGTAQSAQTAPAKAPTAIGAPTATDPTATRIHGVEFSSTSYEVNNASPAARVIVRRSGDTQDELRFVWWTLDDTAKADVDYAPLGRRTEYMLPGQDHMTLYVPIISNPLRHETATFYVALGSPGATERSPSARASVTIDRGG
ncbi:MAG TPA: protein kinase [Steroidobacteraceae bacterium]|jgi:serine/threonine protein kinase|nr:protein kinase [Steroidobacteraceae bacterium]